VVFPQDVFGDYALRRNRGLKELLSVPHGINSANKQPQTDDAEYAKDQAHDFHLKCLQSIFAAMQAATMPIPGYSIRTQPARTPLLSGVLH